ncbi:MAG: TIGR02147 family protein [Chitinispirillaceae bacterium]|nr:TIGR02147 family protein [Chitinispirillaceae bacterium]
MAEMDKNLFEYMDYREFLRDLIDTMKKENPAYSMRAFAAKLACNPGQFNRILKGERNLLPAHIVEIGTIAKFSKKEKRFFELLVSYNHAKKQSEREYFYDQMQQFRKANVKQVSSEQYLLYSHWYYLVIREMLTIVQCGDDGDEQCRRLSKLLEPSVSISEMQDALETMMHIGVLERKDGRIAPAERFTASGGEVPQVIVNRFLLEFTDLARRALDVVPRNQRRFSTLTFSVSKTGYQKISERIDEFRREILGIIEEDLGELDRVYHLNFHLFPVSKSFLG